MRSGLFELIDLLNLIESCRSSEVDSESPRPSSSHDRSSGRVEIYKPNRPAACTISSDSGTFLTGNMRVGASLSWLPLLLIASTSIVSHVGAKPALARRHGDDDMPSTHDEMHAAAPVAATADSQPASHPSSSHSHSHAAPLIELDEASLIAEHGPDVPSYWTYDFGGPGDAEPSKDSHRGFMILHVVAMSLAFFGALPVAIVLRSAKHAWHTYVQGSFLALVMLGGTSGTIYRLATPNFYPGSTHTPIGYIILALVTVLSLFDSLPLLRRLWKFAREKPRPSTVKEFWRNVIWAAEPAMQLGEHEYTGLMEEVNEQVAEDEMFQNEKGRPSYRHHRHASSATFIGQWSNDPEHEDPASPATSSSSRRTFVDSPTRTSLDKPSHDDVFPPQPSAEGGSAAKFGRFLFGFSERILLFLAFLQLLNGGTVYAGQCRGSYIHSCAAHFIKGGIFWAYGILTWCRYLGAFSDLGWAWNRRPTSSRNKHFVPSAEMVESLVIFTYGISNTWMERFEAAPGSPFTTKQYQHISIAVMFWFAGLVGVGLESKTLRKWLSATVVTKAVDINDSHSPVEIQEPPSYTGSFNPFPALVIGITGAAMSAHHQTYAFQVEIHALWGYLLSGFAILRFMTYFFMWLRPPKSILPSRPPTEALASFCLATGGLVFIMSGEEITYALMRRGHDDPMMITNLVAALTSLVFCWFMVVLSIKGWAVSQRRRLEAGQL